MRLRAALGVAVFVGVSLAVIPALSPASRVSTRGAIAFARYRFVNSPLREEIWTANPDGSNSQRLVRAPANTLDTYPDWSPDGSHLLFVRCPPVHGRACEGRQTVWSVRADGSGLHQLSRRCRSSNPRKCPNDGFAVYSPTGRRIAVLRYVGVLAITITDAELHHAHELFPFGKHKGAPDIDAVAWSPDGRRLVFSAHNDNSTKYKPVGGRAIFTIAADGTHLHRLTPWELEAGGDGLAWSAAAGRILFRTVTYEAQGGPGPSYGDIYTVKPDGTALQRLTHLTADSGVQLGSYSPDGTQIVFSTTQGAIGEVTRWPDIFEMNADGSDIHAVTRTRNWEGTPIWGK